MTPTITLAGVELRLRDQQWSPLHIYASEHIRASYDPGSGTWFGELLGNTVHAADLPALDAAVRAALRETAAQVAGLLALDAREFQRDLVSKALEAHDGALSRAHELAEPFRVSFAALLVERMAQPAQVLAMAACAMGMDAAPALDAAADAEVR